MNCLCGLLLPALPLLFLTLPIIENSFWNTNYILKWIFDNVMNSVRSSESTGSLTLVRPERGCLSLDGNFVIEAKGTCPLGLEFHPHNLKNHQSPPLFSFPRPEKVVIFFGFPWLQVCLMLRNKWRIKKNYMHIIR